MKEDAPKKEPRLSGCDLEERTAVFGERVVEFALSLKEAAVTWPSISHIVRSGTSVGANYIEADDAVSRKEFALKIGTCRKEARETQHWLRMIVKAVPSSAMPPSRSGAKQTSFISFSPKSDE
jgi:four helix bundle protein